MAKLFKKEMFRIHGNIFVWTYKGEVFVRKEGANNPRIKINSECDLNEIRKGNIATDADIDSNNVNSDILLLPNTITNEAAVTTVVSTETQVQQVTT